MYEVRTLHRGLPEEEPENRVAVWRAVHSGSARGQGTGDRPDHG
jgi:hypothetical protein